jgi:hypothetical protein
MLSRKTLFQNMKQVLSDTFWKRNEEETMTKTWSIVIHNDAVMFV